MTGSLRDVVEGTDLLLTAGPGGVGKTSTAAALGVAAARSGRRVVVLTVDPARRLADALGLAEGEGADLPHRVDLAGTPKSGELWAVMLDAQATFDRLVREQSPTERQAEAVLGNAVYKALSGQLAGAQEYMAIERLHQLYASGEWDLVIVDTPPSRHALDLLEAPERLTRFLGHPVYRTLTAGQRAFARVTDAASSVFLWAVKRLAGPQLVQDVLEFFKSLAYVEPGLRARAEEVSTLLRAESTSFVVVTSPRSEAVGEANHLIDALEHRGFPFGGVIANLVHPMPESLDSLSAKERKALDSLEPGPLADHVAWHRQLTELALSEREQLSTL
ncbi:MAG: ArsA family ATPase, partial [Ilumatobacter sp.]|nr:ArsA family ATPase [Ilumatobacter sp.]